MLQPVDSILHEHASGKACNPSRSSHRYQQPIRIRFLVSRILSQGVALVTDVSPANLGLIVSESLPAGAVLLVNLPRARSGDSMTHQAKVVRATPLPGGGWRLDCDLVRRLSDEDLALAIALDGQRS